MRFTVDAVFVVSLARRPDRLEAFHKRIPADWPLPPPVVIDAIDGSVDSPPAWWRATRGAWGCYRSHREILACSHDEGLERILVLEDDATFVPDFAARVATLDVPADAAQVYLGGQHLGPPTKGPPGWLVGTNVNRTHAYAVWGRDAMAILLEHLEPDPVRWTSRHHVDHHYGILHRDGRIRAYTAQPWLCGQVGGTSDVGKAAAGERWWRR